jgi:hypothetical protein
VVLPRSDEKIVMSGKLFSIAILLLALVEKSGAAVGLAVSPAGVSYDDPAPFTLTVTGLSPQQTVRIERFHDANGNSQLDVGEPLMLSFQVTDGRVEMFGGVRDEAIPGDEDGAANGQVVVALRLSALPEGNRAIGTFLFRVSPLDSSFSPVVQPFSVLQGSHGQSVRGVVSANGSALPGAMVVALAGEGEFAAGVFTDAAGNFQLQLPTGDYMLAALKPGLLTDFGSAPLASLSSGTTVTQNLVLASGTRTISGRVFDSVSSNGVGGVQVFAESMEGLVGIAHTDGTGNFSLAASSGQWRINLSEDGLRLLGYSAEDVAVDTSGGDVTGVSIALSKGRGKLELVFFFPSGYFGDGTNGSMTFPTDLNYYYALFSLEDVNFPTNVYFTGPSGSGLFNTPSANFGANFEGTSAFYSSPQVNVGPYPPGGVYQVNYKNQPLDFVLPDPDAQNRQVLLVPTVTVNGQNEVVRIDWARRDANGNLIAAPAFIKGIELRIDGMGGRLYDADVAADATGHQLFSPVLWTNVSSIQMVYDDNVGNQYVSFWNRGAQPLQIVSSTNLPPATVNSPYQILPVAAGGRPPYSWSLGNGSLPPGVNFTPVTGEISGTPTTAGTYRFDLRVTDANGQFLQDVFVLDVRPGTVGARLEPKRSTAAGRFEFRVFGQAGQSYNIEYSTDLVQWHPLLSTNAPGDSFDVVDNQASGAARFYRVIRP